MLHALTPVRLTAPAFLPVSLAEAKQHLRVEHSEDDTLISSLIGAATAHLDGWSGILGRCLINQQWRVQSAGFPACSTMPLPFPDVSAAAVTYLDAAGATQTLPPGDILLLNGDMGASIALVTEGDWPATRARPDAVTVTFTAGFGPGAINVPGPIRAAILLVVGDLYKNREAQVSERMRDNPAVDLMLAPYRRIHL
jgi:uncharacterized phiE125 gp8 family phage protein